MIEIEYGDIEIVDDTIQEEVDTDIIIEFEDDIIQEMGLYEQYLKKHSYDPNTNTIIVNGKRVNAGSMDPKTIRRINAFLKDHKYNPNDETILTDYLDANGERKRTQFIIRHGTPGAHTNGTTGYNTANNIENYGGPHHITLDRQYIGHKDRAVPEQVFGHEQGHNIINTAASIRLKDANKIWNQMQKIKQQCIDFQESVMRKINNDDKTEIMKVCLNEPQYKSLAKQYTKLCNKLHAVLKSITGIDFNKNYLDEKNSSAVEKIISEFPQIKEAQQIIQKYYDNINEHDRNPEEFVADIIGQELASKYIGKHDTGHVRQTIFDSRMKAAHESRERITPESVKQSDVREKSVELYNKKLNEIEKQLIDELVKYIEENNVPVKATRSFIGFGWDDIDSEDSMDNLNNMKSIQKIDSYSTIVINGNNNCSVGSLVEFLFRNALSIKLMKMNAGKYRTKFLNGYDFRKAETKLRKFTTNPNNKIYLQFLKIVDKYCIDYINYCKSVEVDTNGTDYSELARTKIGKIDEVINKKTKDMGSNLRSDFMKQQASRQQALERSSATPATPDNTSNDTVTK
jgi:hypothetical protein